MYGHAFIVQKMTPDLVLWRLGDTTSGTEHIIIRAGRAPPPPYPTGSFWIHDHQ